MSKWASWILHFSYGGFVNKLARFFLSLFLVAVCSLDSSRLYAAEALSVAVVGSFKPYVNADHDSGIELDIIREAMSMEGMDVKFKYFKGRGGFNNFILGRVDAIVVNENEFNDKRNLNKQVYVSNDIVQYKNYAISLKSKKLNLTQLDELSYLTVAAFYGANVKLGGYFSSVVSKSPFYKELVNQFDQVIALYRGMVDVVISDKYIFQRYQAEVEAISGDRREVDFHDIFSPSSRRLVFIRKEHRDKFNYGLDAIKENKRYESILRYYAVAGSQGEE